MRVVIDGRFLAQPLSGVQRVARELCRALDEALDAEARQAGSRPEVAGLEITILTPRMTQPPPPYRRIRVAAVGRLRGHAWEQLELPRRSRGADVLFCPGNVAPLASLRGKTPVVVTVHDLAFRYHPETVTPRFRRVYELLVPQALRRAQRVITVSESERALILKAFPEVGSRLVAVANGGPAPPTAERPGPGEPAPPPGPFLLYVGALNKRKNVHGVLAAAGHLLAERPELSAVFVGAGAGAYSAVELDTTDPRVLVTGSISDAALERFYRNASVMLFPSLHEASGLPPVEAMAKGCPVVVSEIPALRERCGDAAVYCDPHSIESIVEAAARVLDDETLRGELVDRGRRRAALYSWERCLDETVQVLRAAAGHPR